MENQFGWLVFDRIAQFCDTVTLKQKDASLILRLFKFFFVLYLEKTLNGNFFNGVRVAYTILHPPEKRKQQLGFYGHTKKFNCKSILKR